MAESAFNIDDMSQEEQLQLIEQIWEKLSSHPDSVPLSPNQRAELDRRLDDLESGSTEGIPWEEVLQQIRRNRR